MNVLQLCSGTWLNGAVLHCLSTSRHLAQRGHNVTLVCRPDSWLERQLHDRAIDVVRSSLNRWSLAELRRITDMARRKRIDVIHTHLTRAHVFGVVLRYLSGIPVVAAAQNRHWQPYWALTDGVIAGSDTTRQFHRRFNFVPDSRIISLPNFVDNQRVAGPQPSMRSSARRLYGIAEDALVLSVVANVCHRKGQLDLVRALPEIVRRFPTACVVLAGAHETDYEESVRRTAAQLGVANHLIVAGQLEDVTPLLAASDINVLPSLEDTMPLALLEAMSAELPIVATRVGGIPECVIDEINGLLVPPSDPSAIAAAVCRLLEDPEGRAEMGRFGGALVARKFSPDYHCRRTEQFYRHVVQRHARAS